MNRVRVTMVAVVAFLAVQWCYGAEDQPARPVRNVIIMISDGCGFRHVEAASLYEHGRPGAQVYEQFPVVLGMSTFSAGGSYSSEQIWGDFEHAKKGSTDSAAAATALACGDKTYNGAIGVGRDKEPLKNIMERAEELKKSSGVVTSVQISHANGGSRGTLLVTSPAPRDGKSMVSANLAISYAAAGFRTILVDADVRRGHAQEMFSVARSPGLTDYLSNQADLASVQQATSVDNLTMIARGGASAFNPEMLDAKVMDELLAALRSEYDVVVLDAPPLAAGADVLVLGKRSDKVVIVLRAGETDSQLARTKLDLIGNVNLPIVGAVLNAVPTGSHYYPYYANYYYADVEPVA